MINSAQIPSHDKQKNSFIRLSPSLSLSLSLFPLTHTHAHTHALARTRTLSSFRFRHAYHQSPMVLLPLEALWKIFCQSRLTFAPVRARAHGPALTATGGGRAGVRANASNGHSLSDRPIENQSRTEQVDGSGKRRVVLGAFTGEEAKNREIASVLKAVGSSSTFFRRQHHLLLVLVAHPLSWFDLVPVSTLQQLAWVNDNFLASCATLEWSTSFCETTRLVSGIKMCADWNGSDHHHHHHHHHHSRSMSANSSMLHAMRWENTLSNLSVHL